MEMSRSAMHENEESGAAGDLAEKASAGTLNVEDVKQSSLDDLFHILGTDRRGLSTQETSERLQRFGYNEIEEHKVNPVLKFLGAFWGPIPWMIEAAAILSGVVQRWDDFAIIFALLLINAVVGFWQEHKADNAIELLKQRLALQARVLRDGKWTHLPSRELVPGDVVRVRLGDIIPADLKLMEGTHLLTDESALTGESLPVTKHVSDVAYSGSVVRQGEMDALVVFTGMNTFFGRTARLIQEARTQSHFQKAVIKIGDYLILLTLALAAVIFLVALFRHESLLETLQFVLILTVAAIPAALPAVLSVTMAVGASALARKEAIVSKLVAIEELAGMDVLCSDKTGTITENKLTVGEIVPFKGYTEANVLVMATMASREEDRDPIDDAILARMRRDVAVMSSVGGMETTAFTPFDPVSKRTEATQMDPEGHTFRVSKGAPQAILSLLSDPGDTAALVDETVDAFAAKGYRALGVAKTDADGAWHYVGLIALYDPPREDSADTINEAKSMGVRVKMVTGDHAAIAKEIAHEVNLGPNILSASSFLNLNDSDATRVVDDADGFAQVFPEHKYRIVELLQKDEHIVGMTGDGVNDAPALKKADAGIAVAGSTDAAKSAADIVLTKPGLSVIIDAIQESRKIFQRMNSYAIYRIAETIRILFFVSLSILIFKFYPVTAIMIVLLALFNDAPIMAIAYDNVRISGQPESWDMRTVLGVASVLGLVGVFFTFSLFYLGDEVLHLNRDVIRSLIFLKLAVAGHLTIFMARTKKPCWSIAPSASLFWSAVLTKIIATFFVVYGWFVTPIGWKLAGLVWGWAFLELLITDYLKLLAYDILNHKGLIFHRRGAHGKAVHLSGS